MHDPCALDSFKFDVFQRKRLSDFGLLPVQIAALETHALRAIALHQRPLRLDQARLVLERLHLDARRLLNTMKSMTPSQLPLVLDSTWRLLLMAHYDTDGVLPSPYPVPDSLIALLQNFADTTERALTKSHEIKERDQSASPEPIRLIVRLIEEAQEFKGRASLAGDLPWSVDMRYKLLLEVAGICYEAAGRENTDPERAVRVYFEQKADREARMIREANLKTPEPDTKEEKAAMEAAFRRLQE